MPEALEDKIQRRIQDAAQLYHRLIIVAAPTGSGKTKALRKVSERTHIPLINLNLELSLKMLELAAQQRALQAADLVRGIIEERANEAILLDNTEILFDTVLQLNSLSLLLQLSKNKIIIASWNGTLQGSKLRYALPGHPEYRSYEVRDFLAVEPESEKESS
jgi:hypothetical protein